MATTLNSEEIEKKKDQKYKAAGIPNEKVEQERKELGYDKGPGPAAEPSQEEIAKGQPTNQEQQLRRQSAPRPTPEDYLRQQQDKMNQGQGITPDGAMNGFRALAQVIDEKTIHEATITLQKYKQGKANLEARIIDNEQWYKLRHWESLRRKKSSSSDTNTKDSVEPVSAWLFNCIANKHADAMDNFPSPNILPREEGDKAEAEKLTSILPVILDENDFEQTYDEVWNYKLKSGTGVYGVFWDKTKLGGLGDIAIRKVDLINLFWESGITDIQQSRNLFHVSLVDNDLLEGRYPQLKGKLSTKTIDVAEYIYDDSVDTTDKSVVVDWYYKKYNSQGKQILHYCQYCNNIVLFATENDPNFAERGFYDHGQYPFVFDRLFMVEGTPAGFGYIDVGKSCQEYIDRGNQAIMKNMLINAKPRYFIRNDGSVNESEYADMENDFIHVDGNLGQDSILPSTGNVLNDIYVDVLVSKIDELKETTGNRDTSTGGTVAGATAASAIAAMQEAGSKLSRDANKSAYRAFRKICLLCIELIRQFYDLPRCFRIMGENGAAQFITYSNENIVPQDQGVEFGVDMGQRVPLFDIEITAQKQSSYSKMAQNELALSFYTAGFFNPANATQALACLSMMDFDRKQFVMKEIAQNGGMLQQLMMLAQVADRQGGGGQFAAAIAQQYGLAMPQMQGDPEKSPEKEAEGNDNLGGDTGTEEPYNTKQARERVAESTSPS